MIRLGTFPTAHALMDALNAAGQSIQLHFKRMRSREQSEWTSMSDLEEDARQTNQSNVLYEMVMATPLASAPTELEIFRVSGYQLGFKGRVSPRAVLNRAKELGFDVCPAEVGPQLRLQMRWLPRDVNLTIAMEPVRLVNYMPCSYPIGPGVKCRESTCRRVYVLNGDREFYLSGADVSDDQACWPEQQWVFTRRKQ